MNAYQIRYKLDGRQHTATRFAETMRAAWDSAERVIEREQGGKLIDIKPIDDPRYPRDPNEPRPF